MKKIAEYLCLLCLFLMILLVLSPVNANETLNNDTAALSSEVTGTNISTKSIETTQTNVFQRIGTKTYGYVDKAYYGDLSSKNTVGVIVGMHPKEYGIHEETEKSLVANDKSLNKKIVLYRITVTKNADDYSQGRMNGQLLGQAFIVPDVSNEKPMFVLDCHENNGANSGYRYWRFLYPISTTPTTYTYINQIRTQVPIHVYTPPNPTSPAYVTLPIAKKGIPTVIYEVYRLNSTANKAKDADAVVKSFNYLIDPNFINQQLNTSNFEQYHGEGKYFKAVVKNQNEQACINEEVDFRIIASTWAKTYTVKTNNLGTAQLQINLAPGTYTMKTSIKNNPAKTNTNTVKVLVKPERNITTNNLLQYYGDGRYFEAYLEDMNGNMKADETINFTIIAKTWQKTYPCTTDLSGLASLQINLAPGTYAMKTSHAQSISRYNTITVLKEIDKYRLASNDLIQYYGEGKYFKGIFYDATGTLDVPKDINFTIIAKTWQKTYTRKTDSDGRAELQINLAPGTYTIKTSYKNLLNNYNKITVMKKIEDYNSIKVITNYLKQYEGEGEYFTATVKDYKGIPIANKNVDFGTKAKTWNKTYTVKTDSNGTAQLKINLSGGLYEIKTIVKNIYTFINIDPVIVINPYYN